jgi:hypothetical protein
MERPNTGNESSNNMWLMHLSYLRWHPCVGIKTARDRRQFFELHGEALNLRPRLTSAFAQLCD